MATRTFNSRPILADGNPLATILAKSVTHTGTETWKAGRMLKEGTTADELIEWPGTGAPSAILLDEVTVGTSAVICRVAIKGLLNPNYISVTDDDTRPTVAQVNLMTAAGLIPNGPVTA